MVVLLRPDQFLKGDLHFAYIHTDLRNHLTEEMDNNDLILMAASFVDIWFLIKLSSKVAG